MACALQIAEDSTVVVNDVYSVNMLRHMLGETGALSTAYHIKHWREG